MKSRSDDSCPPTVTATPQTGRDEGLVGHVLAHLSRETSSGRFIPEMDGLRFVAIGMVFVFHLNEYLGAKIVDPRHVGLVHSDWLAGFAAVGFRGVELFFVISGFILGLPFAARYIRGSAPVNLRKYYLRRLTRLEPPYLVTVIVLFVLAFSFQGKIAAALAPHLAASLCYSHSLIYGAFSPVIGVAWSLEIEVQFYLLVPVLTVLFSVQDRKVRRCFMVGLILLFLFIQTFFPPHNLRLSLSVLNYLQFFLTGFLLADVFLVEWHENPERRFYWDVIAIAGWPILFLSLRSSLLTHWLFPVLVFVLYCAAFRGPLVNRFFANRWTTAIGGMCYSIYLIHYEVISAIGRFTKRISEGVPYWIHLTVQSVVVGVGTVVICGIYFVLLEKPCMRPDWPQRLWRSLRRGTVSGERVAKAGVGD